MNQYLPDSYGDEEILFTPYTGKIQKSFIQQHDEMDCAAATLAMIANSFGKRISLKDCRELIDIGLNGATYYSIVLAADFLGIRTCAANISLDQISELRVPFIAHYQITSSALGNANSHFVVVYQVKGNRILIADPEFDLIWVSLDDFFKRFSGNIIAFDPTEKFFKIADSKPNLVTILSLIKSHRLLITFMVIVSLLISGLSVFPIIYFGKLIDELGKEGFLTNEVLILLAGLMGIKITAQLFKTLRQMLANFLSLKLSYKLTLKMHLKSLQLPLSEVNSRKPGDFLSRIEGTSDVESFVSNAFSVFFVDSIFAIVFLVTLFKMSIYFGLLSIFSVLIFSVFIQQISQWSKKKTYKILSESAMVQTSLVYNLRYLSTMRLFSKETFFFHKWVILFKKLGTYLYFFRRNFLLFKSFESLVMITISGIAMFLGIYLIQKGHFTVGVLVSSLSLLDQCLDPVFSIGQAYDSYLRSMVSIDRMNDILTSKKESTGEIPVHSIDTIEFKDVSFSYNKILSKKVLSDFNLKINRGDFVVLVGESGSGKSTLLSLLVRFYDPSSGSILINGISNHDYRISDIRRKFSLLPQEPVLMPLTIIQNIALGEYQPDLERVYWSLKMANAESFVNNLPMNLDTLLQEDGRGLSGGQKQRIALARALYFDSEVLLLDEPHSALDTASQQMIVDTLKSLNQSGKTVIVSTHRPELFSFANRIVKINQ